MDAGRESLAGRGQCTTCPSFPESDGIAPSKRLAPAFSYLPLRSKTSLRFAPVTR
jgi:hypothetical protein